jgi:hypothetical protein
MAYYKFMDEYAKQPYGSCEIWYHDGSDPNFRDEEDQPMPPGWYWWACFPGCMPDGDAMGPFKTQEEAEEDAEVA